MLKALFARLRQGYRTKKFPDAEPNLPPRFRGCPILEHGADFSFAASVCPVHAVSEKDSSLDIGRCIFCGKCESASSGIRFGKEYRLGAMNRENLFLRPENVYSPEQQWNEGLRKLCGKSLKIRQVSAGGCAACELDFNVLGTLAWDMGRFGIQVVASPRHADCLLVTGPVTRNMLSALKKTYDAMPKPCFVIASGACAISGGLYAESPEACGPVDRIFHVDLYVPGCPPHPATLLEALVRFIGQNHSESMR